MTFISDLQPCNYFPMRSSRLVAVGWLEGDRSFVQGGVSGDVFEKLATLLLDPWTPIAYCGRHQCSLCRFTGGPCSVRVRDFEVQIGSSNVFVPADGCVYVAPSSILHYIDAHQYQPPIAFLHAVMECPPMRSIEYLRKLTKLLPKDERSPPS